jgi:superfamily II DNA or RNA helicase
MPNDVVVYNDHLIISNFSDDVKKFVENHFTYMDKSKQYQLRRMARNTWQRNSSQYTQLKKEVKGNLYQEIGGELVMSSCFVDVIRNELNLTPRVDNRSETGTKISLPWVNKPNSLRDYQEEAVQLMLSNPRGLINFATGLGKTLVALHLVQRYKKRALIVCPSESIARQFYELFEQCLGKHKLGFYGGGKRKLGEVTIGIAASVAKRVVDFQNADLGLVLVDETQHTPATTFFNIAQGLSKVGKLFGLTATDYRSDGKDIMITAGCGPVLIRRDIKWGVDSGWLAEPFFLVRQVDTRGRDFKDDKVRSYKEHVLNNELMKSQIRGDAQKMMAAGKSVLILVDEVAHGQELSKELGIPFATGVDKKSQSYVDDLNNSKINGLVGTEGKIGEGTDIRNIDVMILASFPGSKGPTIQAIGRGLRKQGAKTRCLILDYKPLGSTMLSRHADNRTSYYREITDKVKIV